MAFLRTEKELMKFINNKTTPEPNSGCHLWTASVDKNGYGKIFYNKKHWRVHRLVYAIEHKISLSAKDFIQHKCDTPSCCNLFHLEIGNALTNMQDKVKKGRLRNQYMNATHCKRGHEFNYENTKIEKDGTRTCVICRRKRVGVKVGRPWL